MLNFIQKLFGTKNERELKRIAPLVDEINRFEDGIRGLSDGQLKAKTAEFKEKLAGGMSLDDILTEAFAVVREAARRTVGMRPFDVQLIGGIVLHEGKIAEMKTGEGKTLAATMPLYLNALTGKGCHLVTVNDYLARRDAAWMGPIYNFLDLSVGVIVHGLTDAERRAAYGSDITYGTNNEFGFDYLRDNMKFTLEDYVQRDFHYAIVDEVDSILIDEARTPLIISGPSDESTDKYYRINQIIPGLRRERDYTIDEKARAVVLTEEGVARVEKALKVQNLYDPRNIELLHHVNQALKAHTLFKRDVDYVVKSGEVLIVDEFTGRLMPGRRYSEGLHQALEAKEGVKIERENQTLASVTFQNYFRMYEKLAGMTGTADTEAAEFQEIYGLEVMVIPTNMPMIRTDHPDVIYRTEREKFEAVIQEIKDLHGQGRPVLVGTISIEKSEKLSGLLSRQGVKHHVLNAKHHEREAEIITQAGQRGAVTISTNMAGRGTDIKLGEGVARLGGLHILGTERHESRRIDNQLRGRSGRQGDAGSSRFYLSMEDDLLRIFGGERMGAIMDKIGMEEGQPIESGLLSRQIEAAQRRVEAHNFDIRKHLLEFDNVMNVQREAIYEQRKAVLKGDDLWGMLEEMLDEVAENIVREYVDEKQHPEEWNLKGLDDMVYQLFSLKLRFSEPGRSPGGPEQMQEEIHKAVLEHLRRKETDFGKPLWDYLMKVIMLQSIDTFWKDHLLGMDHLREGIGLRGYAQKDPVREYQKEGYEMYLEMMYRVRQDSLQKLSLVQVQREEEVEGLRDRTQRDVVESHGTAGAPVKQVRRDSSGKVGRNDPCPCGSGKKYKKCCGK
ncbi:MAG: preprotein translocase subunit SecA [Pseudomonadota bacterium]|jgi:preprotein translocase subunit SecA|nr:preprotein translocase subunit SecA [Syntrophaceae bacterium]MBP7032852.1 preprotein translocase subunit SecA [Syntrophobacterales bacterium]MDI9555264.1 preprotein translocase subunit SecA [Pseudomonadota bacterium]NLX30526.1 preprotein translocase subunit SecA [Deltaproteobacteria bacterium]HNU85529.1 preprotein translocase subunit SecA [Syntrophales bacterium]